MKVNHLGKVKSSLMLDPQILTQAKIEAARLQMTLGLIMEDALTEHLKRTRKKSLQEYYQQRLKV